MQPFFCAENNINTMRTCSQDSQMLRNISDFVPADFSFKQCLYLTKKFEDHLVICSLIQRYIFIFIFTNANLHYETKSELNLYFQQPNNYFKGPSQIDNMQPNFSDINIIHVIFKTKRRRYYFN